MRKLPISDYVKGFLTEQGVEFTDHQRASILWNSRRLPGREQLEAIRELGEHTADEVLKRQIGERLAWEEEQARAFLENGDRSCVYMVSENDGPSAGAFFGFDAAMRFGAEQKKHWAELCPGETWQKGFRIGKYLIAGEQPPLIRSPFRANPHIWTEQEEGSPEYVPFDGDPVGGCRVSAEGRVIFTWTREVDAPFDIYDPERFENKPLFLPCPFERGDLVRDTVRRKFGVVDLTRKRWNELNDRVKGGLYADYSDTTTTVVQYLLEDGSFSHDHPCILDLEPATDTDFTDHHDYFALEALSMFMKGVPVGKRAVRSEGTLGEFMTMYDNHRHMREEERRCLELDPAG